MSCHNREGYDGEVPVVDAEFDSAAPLTADAAQSDEDASVAEDASRPLYLEDPNGGYAEVPDSDQNTNDTNNNRTINCNNHEDFDHCHNTNFSYSTNDWSTKLLTILKNSSLSPVERKIALAKLQLDFTEAAKLLAREIIEEVNIPSDKKKHASIDIGHSGGEKFILNGLFFKFARDDKDIYGDDENAMKVAGHEYRNNWILLNFGILNLCFPLMTVIDYCGFRILVSTMLPISDETLVYGSADGGLTLRRRSLQFENFMIELAAKFHLKQHQVGSGDSSVYFCTPADLEGHRGKDGNWYVIDLARLMPPLFPHPHMKVSTCILVRRFRPEFMLHYSQALNCDCFSGFDKHNPSKKIDQKEVLDATHYLINTIIPKCAQAILEQHVHNEHSNLLEVCCTNSKHDITPCIDISKELHKYGINLHLLGHVYEKLHAQFQLSPVCSSSVATQEQRFRLVKECILIEMLSRSVKHMIWGEMRTLPIFSNLHCAQVIIKHLNTLLGMQVTPDTMKYRQVLKDKMCSKYQLDLPKYANTPEMPRGDPVDELLDKSPRTKYNVLMKICDLCGLVLQESTMQRLAADQHHNTFHFFECEKPFTLADVQRFSELHKVPVDLPPNFGLASIFETLEDYYDKVQPKAKIRDLYKFDAIRESRRSCQWIEAKAIIPEDEPGLILGESQDTKDPQDDGEPISVLIKAVQKKNVRLEQRHLKIVKMVNHAHILPIYEIFEDDKFFYFIMQHQTAFHNLEEMVFDCGPLPEDIVKHIVQQLLQVVTYLHSSNIMYRQINAKNVYYNKLANGEYFTYLADFASSYICDYSDVTATQCNSIDYSAPEMLNGKAYNNQIDMWSLGVLAFFLLTGESPFCTGQDPSQDMMRILSVDYEWPDHLKISKQTKKFVSKLLVADPVFRYTAKQALCDAWLAEDMDTLPPEDE